MFAENSDLYRLKNSKSIVACLAGVNYHVWSPVFVRIVCDRVLSQLTSHAIALCVFLFEAVEESLCASRSKPLSL